MVSLKHLISTLMLRIYEDLNEKEKTGLAEMREWALAQGDASEHLIGKLSIAQRIIDSTVFGEQDVWKMNAVGVLFGDALENAKGGRLKWVIAEDHSGPAYALSWQHTEALVYPLSAIRSRLEAGEPVDVYALFQEYSSLFPHRGI